MRPITAKKMGFFTISLNQKLISYYLVHFFINFFLQFLGFFKYILEEFKKSLKKIYPKATEQLFQQCGCHLNQRCVLCSSEDGTSWRNRRFMHMAW
jgi:hypothetical protein